MFSVVPKGREIDRNVDWEMRRDMERDHTTGETEVQSYLEVRQRLGDLEMKIRYPETDRQELRDCGCREIETKA